MAKKKAQEEKERKYRAWFTMEELDKTLTEIQEMAEEYEIELADHANPTPEELANVYKAAFADMSDAWELTANGTCKVEEIKD